MISSDSVNAELVRLRIAQVAMAAGLLFLVAVLWRVQLVHASEYKTSHDRQSMRSIRLPAMRGRIVDRNGVCLADNRPSYCIAVYIKELRVPGTWKHTVAAVDDVITHLSEVLGVPKRTTRAQIYEHIRGQLALPFLAWRDVDEKVLARWAEGDVRHPGVDVYVEPVRRYPEGTLASHLVGYVGKADIPSDEAEPYHLYLPEMVGKYGIEQACNETLVGEAGGRVIRVDASGFKHGEMERLEPRAGESIVLSIDARAQRVLELLLAGQNGAGVVMDPRNGDVLALASAPGFDPNTFSPRLSRAQMASLLADPGKPFFNRAVTGAYPPGSTFKPLVAIASLENGRSTAATEFDCPGFFQLGGIRFHCWRRSGHGVMALRKAIEQSCNAYFCALGNHCGYRVIYHMADALGFGHRTGVGLPYESAGLLPDYRSGWRGGDTCNVSIGQGALLASPLQMAAFLSTLANGGTRYRPRVVLRKLAAGEQVAARNRGAIVPGEVIDRMSWSPATLDVVRGGMYDVVQAESGTGKRARIDAAEMAGKTGTAEYGPRAARRKYAWMTVFAPFHAPRYAAVMVIEDAVSGGVTIAPRMRQLMAALFDLEQGRTPELLRAEAEPATAAL